jgi:hypothetical protein
MTILLYLISPVRNMIKRMQFNMQHNQSDHDHVNLGLVSAKIPPAWSPERDRHYPLRTWVLDLRLWARGTDVDNQRMGPVAAMRVGGSAREFIRELDTNVLANGMMLADANGNQAMTTGLECLIRALQRRYGPLQQELEVHVLTEILGFRRQAGEDTDSCIGRYEIARDRALQGANFDMSWVGFAFLLLTALHVPKQSWPILLSPTQGNLPQDQPQYNAFVMYLRRSGHMTDRQVDPVKNMNYFAQEEQADSQQTYVGFTGSPQWTPQTWNTASYFDTEQSEVESEPSSANSDGSEPDLSDLYAVPYNTAGEQLYLAYRHNKRRWRKFTGSFGKGRSFRKGGKKGRRKGGFKSSKGSKGFPGKFQGKHPGSFKGKGPRYFTEDSYESDGTEWADQDWSYFGADDEWAGYGQADAAVYVGKGKFKRGNPKGKDGKTLTCSLCGSEDHFVAKCPQNKQGVTHTQQTSKSFHATSSTPSGSSGSSNWGSMFFYGSEHVEQDHAVFEFADGSVFDLSSELLPVFEQPDEETETSRHYHLPSIELPKPKPALSRAQESSEGHSKLARQFAFVWFMPPAFHTQVRLKDGRESLLVDIGAVENLTGSLWVGRTSELAKQAGQGCSWQKLKKTLSVEGVGQQANHATEAVTMPICLEDGMLGTFQSAVVEGSELPALFGLNSLAQQRAIIDTYHRQLIFVGPGGYKIQLSPGSKTYKLHQAPTGHLLLPCTCWDKGKVQPGKPGIAL